MVTAKVTIEIYGWDPIVLELEDFRLDLDRPEIPPKMLGETRFVTLEGKLQREYY